MRQGREKEEEMLRIAVLLTMKLLGESFEGRTLSLALGSTKRSVSTEFCKGQERVLQV